MSFELKTLPATFQRMMNDVLSCLSGTRCLVFLDDIYIYTNSLVEHDGKLQDVLEKFRKHNLKFQPSKSEFFRKEVTFLRHKISELRFEPAAHKIEAVKNFLTSKMV
jgi:hypothetical protein